MNIPIYRAKRIDSDEYVVGFYCNESEHYEEEMHFIYQNTYYRKGFIIDPTTLAIHFPYMLDSEGNKIFASLSEDGKGGDMISCETKASSLKNQEWAISGATVLYSSSKIGIEFEEKIYYPLFVSDVIKTIIPLTELKKVKITGIKE